MAEYYSLESTQPKTLEEQVLGEFMLDEREQLRPATTQSGAVLSREARSIGRRVSLRAALAGRLVAVLGLLLAHVILFAPQVSARAPAPEFQGTIGVGDALFWNGELFVAQTTGGNLPYGFSNVVGAPVETCGNPDPCWAYIFDVTEAGPGTRLRVAIDTNRRGDCFQVEAWPPGTYGDPNQRPDSILLQCPELFPGPLAGTPPGDILTFFVQIWNKEGPRSNPVTFIPEFIPNPALGTWTLRVVPFLVEDWGFRLRVKLESAKTPHAGLAPPDLRAYPPYEFGFRAPANPNAGTAVDKQNPPGPQGISCTEDERAEAAEQGREPPERCLRFSAAVYNIGKGPLDLLLQEDGKVVQRIHRANGEVGQTSPAGEWTFHEAHRHSHYVGFADFELYRILDTPAPKMKHVGTKRLDPASSGQKSGWHPADQRFANWERVDQAFANAVLLQCFAQEEECITRGEGWGDHYRWQRPVNYVEFPSSPDADGHYVVRMVVDRDNRVVESSDRNNTAYAWIRVQGEEVTICERGLGLSPWDPLKQIHTDSFWLSTAGGTTADSQTERQLCD